MAQIRIVGGPLDGQMTDQSPKQITKTIDGLTHIAIEFKDDDKSDHKIFIPAGSEPATGIQRWKEFYRPVPSTAGKGVE